jgi:hypothetical protein
VVAVNSVLERVVDLINYVEQVPFASTGAYAATAIDEAPRLRNHALPIATALIDVALTMHFRMQRRRRSSRRVARPRALLRLQRIAEKMS